MEPDLFSPDKLILDIENPRFSLPSNASQSDALRYLFENCDLKELWNSIVENGFLAFEPLVVYPDPDKNKYVVVEGNRRLAAVKTLLKPELIADFSKSSVPTILEKHLPSLHNLPVNVIKNRNEANEYIGFRHVNGARSWEPLAKARFGLKLLEKLEESHGEGFSDKDRVQILAHRIGDSASQITKNLVSFKVLKQALDLEMLAGDFLEKGKNDFSHLYTILSNPDTREYIGLGREALQAEQIRDNPVPDGNHEQLGNLITWLYGKADENIEPLIKQQGTDRPKLQKVIACTAALERLEETGNFKSAIHIAGIDGEDWFASVLNLDNTAQRIFEKSSDALDTLSPEDREKAKEQLERTIERLKKIVILAGENG